MTTIELPAEQIPDAGQKEQPRVYEMLTEEELALYCILTDHSGLDFMEFAFVDETTSDGCWRAWPFQWSWWRAREMKQIDQCARAIGKSESIMARSCSFPFRHPGQEMVITAPEGNHVDAITDRIESRLTSIRLLREMLSGGVRGGIKHKPFVASFANGARLMGRLPQRTGVGIKGCTAAGTLVLTRRGLVPIEEIVEGDEVLTHRNRWRPVVATYRFDAEETRLVTGQGHPGLITGDHHRFLVRPNTAGPKQRRRLAAPAWADVDDCLGSYWCSPMTFPVEPAPDVPFELVPLMWVAGAYLADGHIDYERVGEVRRRFRTHFVVHESKAAAVQVRIEQLGLNASIHLHRDTHARRVEVSSKTLALWLEEHCGRGAHHKHLPPFALGLHQEARHSLLEGYLHGDGHYTKAKNRWQVTSASKALALGTKLLGQSLGFSASYHTIQPTTTEIAGVQLKSTPALSHQVHLKDGGHPIIDSGVQWSQVKHVELAGPSVVYDISVAEDFSYVGDGIISHNTHPVCLEQDEAQDYPHKGWMEIIATLNRHVEGAEWRAHGVTKGVRDDFYDFTNSDDPENDWFVHRYTAVHKPTFTAKEREDYIKEYGGSVNSPDFRRNVYGLHGDATNPIFVLQRFMHCVDQQEGSDYNTDEYWFRSISAEMVADRAGEPDIENSSQAATDALLALLDFPESHRNHKVTWAGMDVGLTTDPSEILVFGEYTPAAEEKRRDQKSGVAVPLDGQTRLKLLTRIHLERIPDPLQADVIMAIVAFYRPRAFSVDKTGLGLGLFQELQKRAGVSRLAVLDVAGEGEKADPEAKAESQAQAKQTLTAIKGYNFSEKLVVEIDEEKAAELPATATPQEVADKAGIKRHVKDHSTDCLRTLVDNQRLLLPWDREVMNQWNGQTWAYSQSPIDAYGNRRRTFSEGTFHCLDAGRMAALGMFMAPIEEMLKAPPKKKRPVFAQFIS